LRVPNEAVFHSYLRCSREEAALTRKTTSGFLSLAPEDFWTSIRHSESLFEAC